MSAPTVATQVAVGAVWFAVGAAAFGFGFLWLPRTPLFHILAALLRPL